MVPSRCPRRSSRWLFVTKLSMKPQTPVNRDGPWLPGCEGTKCRFTIGGLTPSQMYYFRLAAFGPNGWSPLERHRPVPQSVGGQQGHMPAPRGARKKEDEPG